MARDEAVLARAELAVDLDKLRDQVDSHAETTEREQIYYRCLVRKALAEKRDPRFWLDGGRRRHWKRDRLARSPSPLEILQRIIPDDFPASPLRDQLEDEWGESSARYTWIRGERTRLRYHYGTTHMGALEWIAGERDKVPPYSLRSLLLGNLCKELYDLAEQQGALIRERDGPDWREWKEASEEYVDQEWVEQRRKSTKIFEKYLGRGDTNSDTNSNEE